MVFGPRHAHFAVGSTFMVLGIAFLPAHVVGLSARTLVYRLVNRPAVTSKIDQMVREGVFGQISYETYLIPGETLIPGGRGKRFTLCIGYASYLGQMVRIVKFDLVNCITICMHCIVHVRNVVAECVLHITESGRVLLIFITTLEKVVRGYGTDPLLL